MILTLQVNQPMLVGTFDHVVTIYVRQYGAGNLRLGMIREDLQNQLGTAPGSVVDGIPQAAADGIKQYFWSGDLWLISDVAGPVMVLAPLQSFYIDRTLLTTKPANNAAAYSEIGNLSTYPALG
jgi:hypothetical protein